jgi:hypothetical protein
MELKTRIFYAVCDAAGNLGGDTRKYSIKGAAMFFMERYLGCEGFALVTPNTYINGRICKIALTRFRKKLAHNPHLISDLCTANELLFTLEKHYIQNGKRPLAAFIPRLGLR